MLYIFLLFLKKYFALFVGYPNIYYRAFFRKEVIIMKYVCDVCGYVYDPAVGDPDNGIAPGTPWEDVPEEWVCPLCSVGKDEFSAE